MTFLPPSWRSLYLLEGSHFTIPQTKVTVAPGESIVNPNNRSPLRRNPSLWSSPHVPCPSNPASIGLHPRLFFHVFFREEVDEQEEPQNFGASFLCDETPSNKKYHLANAQSKLSSKHLAWGIHLIVAWCFLMALFIMFQATVKQWSATCQPNVLQPGFAKTSNMVPLKDHKTDLQC